MKTTGISRNNEPGMNTAVLLEAFSVTVEDGINALIREGRPLTIWQAMLKTDSRDMDTIISGVEKRLRDGTLAKFRVGILHYYAPPVIALAGQGPRMGTVLSDMARSLLLNCKYYLAIRRNRT